MADTYEIIADLTNPELPADQRRERLSQFAQAGGWRPSDTMPQYAGTTDIANGHLVVEHGLEHAAVISFLKSSCAFVSLTLSQRLRLMELSYNNLVDWHLFPDTNGITVVYNRTDPLEPVHFSIDARRDVWRAEAFAAITEKRPHPNLRSLDDALIDTLRKWKNNIATELGTTVRTGAISALFNAILLVRAVEDHRRLRKPNLNQVLLAAWAQGPQRRRSLVKCILACFDTLGVKAPRKELVDAGELAAFDRLDHRTVQALLGDFYKNHFAPYHYDFSIISKHAMSRIYEHYVSLFREKDDGQLKLFPVLPEGEISNRALGSFYTPQFIPRFFARYLRENLPPRAFRALRTADPACGSGIFLRTLLEMQCDPLQDVGMDKPTREAFSNVLGIDVDPSACQAALLSLALLHLVLTDEFPDDLNIVRDDALSYLENHRELMSTYDVVMTNPPFIPWPRLPQALRQRLVTFLGSSATGRLDIFLGLLKLGMEMLKPGGHLLYVLPHSFLVADNSRQLRNELGTGFWVMFLADLSQIPVFDKTGSYTILLVARKRAKDLAEAGPAPKATVVRCRDAVGHALQDSLEGRLSKTDSCHIYEVDQSAFRASEWYLDPPEQTQLLSRLERLPTISQYMQIRQGFITGADDLFIRPAREIPRGESAAYRPYLSDREMGRYAAPARTKSVVFYPYVAGEKLTEERLTRDFTHTWEHLCAHRKALEDRSSLSKYGRAWWEPLWPRPPEHMMRPKIVTPQLVLLPRFSLDVQGRFAVSHCPFMYPKAAEGESALEMLRYFLAVLNSSVAQWQIGRQCHRYSRGYWRLAGTTLEKIHVPDPGKVPVATMKKLQELVGEAMGNPDEEAPHCRLDLLVAELYGLARSDRLELGLEG